MNLLDRIIKLFRKPPPVNTAVIEGRCAGQPGSLSGGGTNGNTIAMDSAERVVMSPEAAGILARSRKNARWN